MTDIRLTNSSDPDLVSEGLRLIKKQSDELSLKIDPSNQQDLLELHYLLNEVLTFSSVQAAVFHQNSNKLGARDLKDPPNSNQSQCSFCPCCGFSFQQEQLSVKHHDLKGIRNLGEATYAFFKTIKNVIYLLTCLFFLFSIYSLISNLTHSRNAEGLINISLASKRAAGAEEDFLISCWLGVACMVIWAIFLGWMKYKMMAEAILLNCEQKTVAHYSLLIEKMPTDLTKEQMQAQFTRYFQQIEDKPAGMKGLHVEKYNEGKPFYFNHEELEDAQLKKVLLKSKELKKEFVQWVVWRRKDYRFRYSQVYREQKYVERLANENRKRQIYLLIIQRIKNQFSKKNLHSKTTSFVSFATKRERDFVLNANKEGLFNQLKSLLPCSHKKSILTINKNKQRFQVNVMAAPNPEDVIWANIGVTNCEKLARKLLTFTFTLVLLGITFLAVYALNFFKSTSSQIVSIIISLVIAVVNIILGVVIQSLTLYERDYSYTNYQISLTFKTILAQLVNSVIIPILASWYIKNNNIFEREGLAENIFYISIVTSLLPPFTKVVNPLYIYNRIYIKYKTRELKRLGINQYELNIACERIDFEVGYEHIYVLNLFLFNCFFVSLQPIIPVFAVLGLILMYWIEKYQLFNRCQRPVPSSMIIIDSMHYIITFGATAFALGNLTWSNFIPESPATVIFRSSLLPNLISSGIALLILIVPPQFFFMKQLEQLKIEEEVFYDDSRIFFPSEYDRLNPSTAQAGIEDYKKFLQKKKSQIEKLSPEIQNEIEEKLQKSAMVNFSKKAPLFNLPFQNSETRQIYLNLIKNQSRNTIGPNEVAKILSLSHKNRYNRRQINKPAPYLQSTFLPKIIESFDPHRSNMNDKYHNSDSILEKDEKQEEGAYPSMKQSKMQGSVTMPRWVFEDYSKQKKEEFPSERSQNLKAQIFLNNPSMPIMDSIFTGKYLLTVPSLAVQTSRKIIDFSNPYASNLHIGLDEPQTEEEGGQRKMVESEHSQRELMKQQQQLIERKQLSHLSVDSEKEKKFPARKKRGIDKIRVSLKKKRKNGIEQPGDT